jgi:hypothetical protein
VSVDSKEPQGMVQQKLPPAKAIKLSL